MTWTPRPGPCPGSCRQPPTAAPVDRFHAARRLLISLLRSGHESGAWAAGVDPVAGVELIIAVVKGALLSPSRAGVSLTHLSQLTIAADRFSATDPTATRGD